VRDYSEMSIKWGTKLLRVLYLKDHIEYLLYHKLSSQEYHTLVLFHLRLLVAQPSSITSLWLPHWYTSYGIGLFFFFSLQCEDFCFFTVILSSSAFKYVLKGNHTTTTTNKSYPIKWGQLRGSNYVIPSVILSSHICIH